MCLCLLEGGGWGKVLIIKLNNNVDVVPYFLRLKKYLKGGPKKVFFKL